MAIKKSSKRRGAFRRVKSVPQKRKETIRVKTFIVEKPVYVPARGLGLEKARQKILEEQEEELDSLPYEGKSSFSGKKRNAFFKKYVPDEEELVDGELEQEDADFLPSPKKGKKSSIRCSPEKNDEEVSGEEYADLEGEELSEEEGAEENLEEGAEVVGPLHGKHARSRAMSSGVWWKKGVLWGFLFWLLVVAFAFSLELFGMVSEVTNKGNWLFFLIIFIAVSCIYHRFYNKPELV